MTPSNTTPPIAPPTIAPTGTEEGGVVGTGVVGTGVIGTGVVSTGVVVIGVSLGVDAGVTALVGTKILETLVSNDLSSGYLYCPVLTIPLRG